MTRAERVQRLAELLAYNRGVAQAVAENRGRAYREHRLMFYGKMATER